MKKLFLLFAISFSISSISAQDAGGSQTIRGKVFDMQSKYPLFGANVILADVDPIRGTATNIDGEYRLDNVPLGRHTLRVTYLGYKDVTIPNVIVASGKEVILNFELEEFVITTPEVVITAEKAKNETNNEMTTVSARSFTIEETQRYAGSWADPARMSTNYAGVASAGDQRNDIIIRGNSPLGLLWRLDGINIPNPSHFGSLGTTGGPISILNNNTLSNSDFLTGAFPAEYGNALSGAFDLKMRTGNNEKREYTGQVGFNGFELGAEGPFSKKSKASYLINYRYSTLGVFDALGINLGVGGLPQYQDVSFKLDVPTAKYGRFSLFGIGGKSYIELLDSERDSADWTYGNAGNDIRYDTKMGALGFSHLYFFNPTTRIKTNLAISGTSNTSNVDSISTKNKKPMTIFGQESYEAKYSVTSQLNKKLSAKDNYSIGFIMDMYDINYSDSTTRDGTKSYIKLTDTKGTSELVQAYVQWQHKFTDLITINTGVHYQLFTDNNSNAIEPRLGIKWNFAEKQILSLGAGMHSQMQPMSIYHYETRLPDGSYIKTNEDLNFAKSIHAILGYDYNISRNFRIKAETYYQHLYSIPVEMRSSYASGLNVGSDFGIASGDSLVNEGTGKNYGIELTIEKFFSKNYYFLVTGSLFESKYKGSDGIERNTAFNGNYVVNALAGFEIHMGKTNVLAFDFKVTGAGGKRYVPIDLNKSNLQSKPYYLTDDAYKHRYPDYFRADIKMTYKINSKKISQEIGIDVQNIFGTKNILTQSYDRTSQSIKTEYQLGVFPVGLWKIYF